MGTEKGRGGTKVPTGRKKEVLVPARCFAFVEAADVLDLAVAPLKIKQVTLIDPKDKQTESEDVTLEIWEIQGNKKEKKEFPIVKLIGKVAKADGFNFRLEKLDQDEKKFPKPINGNGTHLWMEAELKVVGHDDKARGLGEKQKLTFVLPPLEYDDTLEFELRSPSHKESAVGNAKGTFGTFEKMLAPMTAQDMTHPDIRVGRDDSDAGRQIDEGGNLKLVVVHCMCAIVKDLEDKRLSPPKTTELVGDQPSRCFDAGLNLEIFKRMKVSAHFLIERVAGKDGNIVKAVHVDRVARHAYSPSNTKGFQTANAVSIGIELLGFADGFRDGPKGARTEFNNEKKNKLKEEKATLEKALAKRQAEKAAGVKEVTVGGEKMTIDEAVRRIEKAIVDLDAKIAATPFSPRGADFERLFADKRSDGVSKCFLYTDKQYAALGKLLEVLGRRYGYQQVCSHHYINPAGKTDPGKFFDWGRLTPYLLPGSLAGDESRKGGLYTVKR